MKSATLKNFFEVERDHCNQMVASVRHQSQLLDTAEFNWFLSDCLDPLMTTLDGESNQKSFPVALAGFKHGLELASLNWLKNEGKREILLELWTGLYCDIKDILLQEPARTFTQTGNLLSHVYGLDSDKPRIWIGIMSRVSDALGNLTQLRQAGLVGAWMSGLAHYRGSALRNLLTMPEALARKLLELPEDRDLQKHLDDMARNRWLRAPPETAGEPKSAYRHETRVGACNLLGGDFPKLPEVFAGDKELFIRSGDLAWQLYVDVYGSSLLPCDPGELDYHERTGNDARKSIRQETIAGLDDILDITSAAALADTVALTSAETFAIIVLSKTDVPSHEAE